mmetsp:Transcript_36294/g.104119  ORF Transcript_36294/g.104119 Transcript_36294/m.104119 type:complete len:189 (-) Transcript_36294:471-1037(-)
MPVQDDRGFSCEILYRLLILVVRFPSKIVTTTEMGRSILKCEDEARMRYPYFPDHGEIALPSASVIAKSLLISYKELMLPSVVELINRELNCEDVALNWLVASISGDNQSGVFLDEELVEGIVHLVDRKGLSKKMNPVERRSACLNMMVSVLAGWPVPHGRTVATVISKAKLTKAEPLHKKRRTQNKI